MNQSLANTALHAITEYFSGPLGKLELVATLLLIVNVYLLGKQRLSNYWFGFAGVILFGFLFREFKLYSDMLLQWTFYAPLQIVGFVLWKYGRTLGADQAPPETDSMEVVLLPRRYWPVLIAVVMASAGALGWYMSANTDASFPYADALTTTMSVGASILMLKKILENWVLWIAMDLIAIPVYFLKGLYITSGLYVIFLALAVLGLFRWLKDFRTSKLPEVSSAG
ncbi:MAG: nicotinamide riboside transporter PnuC [Pseudomonadota bacterium]